MNSYDKMCDEQLLEIVNNPDDFDAAAVKKAKSILDGRKYIAQRTGGSENSQITEYLSMLLESQNIHTSILHKIEKYCLFFVIVTCVSLFIAFILAIWAASLAGSF